ncbi:MAG: tyrosine-type recombinase/integrase [Muribaculaceae bacterium]|nr:tyrosine-type recombinase/integrase [Muribaculaceae bacterium]
MKINLYLDSKKINKQGLYPLRISVSFQGIRIQTSLGISISQAEFDSIIAVDKKRFTQRCKDVYKLVSSIEDALGWEEQKIKRGETTINNINLLSVINACKGKKETKKDYLAKELFILFIKDEQKKKDLSDGTINFLYSTIAQFSEFDNNLVISKMATYEWLHKFVEYTIQRGVSNSTTHSIYYKIRWFLRWCYRNNYCSNDFEKYKLEIKTIDTKDKAVIFLTLDEIMAIKSLQLEGMHGIVRDFFLFLCFTGLRFSDASRLKKTDYNNGVLSVYTKKTGVYIENKLNSYAREIVKKYINTHGELLFPNEINVCRINNYIRDIGKIAGINELVKKIEYRNHTRQDIVVPKWQLLTTHVGRKSFVVNSLDMGLTANQVIAYTGHSTIQAMQPYISISKKKKDAAMDVWDEHATSLNKTDNIDDLESQIDMLKKRIDKLREHK